MSNGKFTENAKKKSFIWLFLGLLVVFCIAVCFLYNSGEQQKPNDTNQPVHQGGSHVTQPGLTDPSTGIDPTDTQPLTSAPDQTDVPETSAPEITVQKAEAGYEHWLAATLIVGVSMEYPDFIPEGIYTTSKTSLTDKFSSDGVFIVFRSGGSLMAIHSKPIRGERAETGTMDISSETIGFATFDHVDPADLDLDSMERIELEDLGELIAQSLLISIYAN